MEKSLISCIIPVFNGTRYLREAVESILGQTYWPIEIIVVDDGSTDNTAKVVRNYRDQVRYVWQPNGGPSAARNQGVSATQGAFVAFLDQDDVWHPEKLTRQMTRFVSRPELDLCVTHVQTFWIPELCEEAARFRQYRLARAVPGYLTGTLLARRALFQTVGLFDTTLRYGDAADWFLRAAEQGAVMELLPDVLMYHRIHHANLSRRKASASREEFLQIVKSSLDRRRYVKKKQPALYEFPRQTAAKGD